jgi:hypothetical protein
MPIEAENSPNRLSSFSTPALTVLTRATWTKDPEKIIAAVKRGHQVLDSVH